MPKRILYQRFKIFGHILFWILSITFIVAIFSFYGENLSLRLLEKSLTINFFFAASVYINLYYLFPGFLKKKKYVYYIFWLVVLLTVSSLVLQMSGYLLFQKSLANNSFTFSSNLHSAYFFSTLFYVGLTSFLKFIKDWISMQDLNYRLARIEQQKLEAELKTLKSQLNPHFLFNSLNNIYSLSLVKSDKVPDLILRLSELMRHIIYESKDNFIPIERELDFVNNFIELQRIRVSEKVSIHYQITGKIPARKIAPLIFEPFIDNAFKHGLPGANQNGFIEIAFNFETENLLKFTATNGCDYMPVRNSRNSGIGLENVKQRLKLLYRPEEYFLSIEKLQDSFTVLLTLTLK